MAIDDEQEVDSGSCSSSCSSGDHNEATRLPRDHSYLEESHPLCLPDHRVVGKDKGRPNNNTLELAVLQLHGVVLFPNCTIPVKLQNRSLIRYLGDKIRLCRHDPLSQPKVQLGIVTYESSPLSSSPSELRLSSSRLRPQPRRRHQEEPDTTTTREQHEQHEQQLRRGSWMRQRFSFGTIATVQYTHERTTIINRRGNNNSNSNSNSNHDDVDDDSSSLWRRYEDMDEIVFTAIGTSRFRILSCVNDDDNDWKIFKVVELNDEPLPRPPFSTRPLPFRTQQYQRRRKRSRERSSDEECTYDDEAEEEEEEEESTDFTTTVVDNTNRRPIQRQTDRMAQNLSQLTAVPFFVYRHWMPNAIVEKIVMKLNTNDGRDNLPSLGKDDIVSNRTNNLEPIRFSYWMANNAPFSENERLKLLRMNSVLERLLFIWKAIKKLTETNTNGYSFITCNICEIPFTTVSDVFTVCGAEGTTSTYVNRSGFIHQITTLRNVDTHKISFQGNPSTENSYFPGYSWRITCCRRCGSLLGWKFQKIDDTKTNDRIRCDKDTLERPSTFYGFMTSNVKVRTSSTTT
ncbi:hypothetical protein FRACYDRAFT_250931 [Fragilariopsis cylindrus CCMP1102]|uniref:CULT domain-containing protein n=1 Tax=Fragilariopsis cylindrus CCMP1102 TaxID=635003 RepID=A0A1E7ENJ1_9STRA|nr:hypothetical protein FRACYDRAFT_250931 [Fragilariopsis cylindrus CCMP1102]|eukprot:OEU07510.1 hypothetical protein FRACYDRAFT_250931 [Fragilariopsis cylindrus CCMP1102]